MAPVTSTIGVISDIGGLVLTLIVAYFGYQRFVSPKTKLYDGLCTESGQVTVKLKNTGYTNSTFRIKMWTDGGLVGDSEFESCLYANIPISGPGGCRVFPKRTKIDPGDFRQFSTHPFQTRGDPIPIPREEGRNTLILEVDQTGEKHIFEYYFNETNIDAGSFRKIQSYGGNTFSGKFKESGTSCLGSEF